ncbi:Molybdopterin biosynthesis MoaE [Amanita rubescens]|nr:Molybdopterin biosynthesis MoaE [Amanita rubescens]
MDLPAASTEGQVKNEYGTCTISYTLDVNRIIKSVQDDRAGAIATFIGTTRNSFNGKAVRKLEYQAYTRLALKTMTNIVCDAAKSVARSEHTMAREPTSSIIHCALHHRIGIVPVGEPSIVIAVSSPHRKEAFLVCELILEEVKGKAQIWKREFYEGEDDSMAEWKENQAS